MARVRIAKATSGAAFVSKKKACEARLAAQEAGEEVEPFDDIFELQHHHLLRCLEKATVSARLRGAQLARCCCCCLNTTTTLSNH